MKVSRTLMRKIFPMFLSLVLIIGLVGVNVKATIADEPQNETQEELAITEDEGIQADETQEPIVEEPEEIIEDTTTEEPEVITDDAEEVTEEEPVIEPAEEEVYEKLVINKTWDLTDGGETSDLLFDIDVYEDAEMTKALFSVENITMEKQEGTEWTVDVAAPEGQKFNKAYTYKLEEQIPDNFDIDELEFTDGTFEITNTYVEPTEDGYTELVINKSWNLTAGGKTEDISFNVLVFADDEKPLYTKKVTMKKADYSGTEWKTTVTPGADEHFKTEYEYEIDEIALPKEFTYDWGFEDGTFDVTNTYKAPVKEYDYINVTKIWDLTKGGSTSDITFTVYDEKGNKCGSVTMKKSQFANEDTESEDAAEEDEETVSRKYTWNAEILPKSGTKFTSDHKYTLGETGQSEAFDVSGLLTFDYAKGSFTVTNTYNPGSEDTFSIFVRKYWSGGVAEMMNLNLYQDIKPGEGEPYLTYELYADVCEQEDGSWYFQIDNLPKGHNYYMSESAVGYTGTTPVIITENGLKGWKVTNTYTGGGNGSNETTTVDTTSAKTGDDNNLIIYIVILLVAAAAVVGALIYKKKNK